MAAATAAAAAPHGSAHAPPSTLRPTAQPGSMLSLFVGAAATAAAAAAVPLSPDEEAVAEGISPVPSLHAAALHTALVDCPAELRRIVLDRHMSTAVRAARAQLPAHEEALKAWRQRVAIESARRMVMRGADTSAGAAAAASTALLAKPARPHPPAVLRRETLWTLMERAAALWAARRAGVLVHAPADDARTQRRMMRYASSGALVSQPQSVASPVQQPQAAPTAAAPSGLPNGGSAGGARGTLSRQGSTGVLRSPSSLSQLSASAGAPPRRITPTRSAASASSERRS